MHNLGRTFFSPDTESEDDHDSVVDEFDTGSDGNEDDATLSTAEHERDEDQNESDDSLERPFSEEEELELAAELLDVENEEQLDEFLGGLLGRVARRVGRRLPKNIGELRRGLKRVASVVKRALPIAGAVAGGPLGLLGTLVSELEGLDPEERELEAARRYVRIGATAAKAALGAPAGIGEARAAKLALAKATRMHMPELLRSSGALPVVGRFELHGSVPGQRVLVIRGI